MRNEDRRTATYIAAQTMIKMPRIERMDGDVAKKIWSNSMA